MQTLTSIDRRTEPYNLCTVAVMECEGGMVR